MISIKGLSKTFSSNHQEIKAVDDLALTIQEGEIFGVIGYSGAGKSTFVRLLNRLEEPSKGQITINDQDITALSTKELRLARRDIGMIFQHFNLLIYLVFLLFHFYFYKYYFLEQHLLQKTMDKY